LKPDFGAAESGLAASGFDVGKVSGISTFSSAVRFWLISRSL